MSFQRLEATYAIARQSLLDARNERSFWEGELSASALSTATAISALVLYSQSDHSNDLPEMPWDTLIQRGIAWLKTHQNEDGGWGDTDKSYSNIATTFLVVAAFHLADQADEHTALLAQAEHYIDRQQRFEGLRRRYGKDKTFVVPILTNLALADLAAWNDISPLPFELACLPQSFYRFARIPVVSYAIPALVAIGQARYYKQPPWNPLVRWIRRASIGRSLRVLERMQPSSGGYLEAVPLTSFVIMSLAGTDRASHEVTRLGVRFLQDSVRQDGSWPIDTNLATWNTTLALQALASGHEDLAQLGCLDWLLGCQHLERHAFTGAEPGGWGWTDLSGAVPDSDDTPSALLALDHWRRSPSCSDADRTRIEHAARAGLGWLIRLQNRNGGWPTFCRGWGKLPFDRSGADLTAHALRALYAWQDQAGQPGLKSPAWSRSIQRGFRFLQRQQQPDGSWIPLWFGNQDHANEENPVYGTGKVLLAYRDWQRTEAPAARRGFQWLRDHQQPDGGWGGGPALAQSNLDETCSSVEETALGLEALLADAAFNESQHAINKGLTWMMEAVENGRFRENSAIGFYFAKLWYHEELYPITFTVSTLGQALQSLPGDWKWNLPHSLNSSDQD